jgi:CDP-diglyceride synthetase
MKLLTPQREDILYGALRRISGALTGRLATNNPVGSLLVILTITGCVLILINAIAGNTASLLARDFAVKNVDDLALKS